MDEKLYKMVKMMYNYFMEEVNNYVQVNMYVCLEPMKNKTEERKTEVKKK